MTAALAILALHAASAAIKRAHEVLLAAGLHTAAANVRQAGELVASAVGLVVVDRARHNHQETTS